MQTARAEAYESLRGWGAEVIVVRVGAEGGDVNLYGRRRSNEQWEFRREISDSSWALLDEASEIAAVSVTPESSWVPTWSEAIALLDRNPWALLLPLAVHIDFRDEVLFEVTRRLLDEPSKGNEEQLDRWLAVCG